MWAFVLLLQVMTTPLIEVCPAFGVPIGGNGYDRAGVDYALDSEAINVILAIDGDSFWIGYENGGFDWPDDVQPELTLTLDMADGDQRWVDVYWSKQTPEVYYVLPYVTIEPYADSHGEHWGTHPCAAIRITADAYAALIEAME